jgi:hypothetical protein
MRVNFFRQRQGGQKAVIVVKKVVVVVGCFAASTAQFLLKFGQHISGPL